MDSTSYFNSVAHEWDALRQNFFSEKVRDAAIAAAAPEPGGIAADIGAGTGFITRGLLQKGLRVIAVDRSEAMIRELKAKFPGVDGRIGHGERLPVEDASVSYVFANMYLHHVETPEGAIREMTRILKPGGVLALTDLDTHSFEFLKREHRDRWMGFDRRAVAGWLREAELEDVRVTCAGQNCCADSLDGSGRASISIFLACGRKKAEKTNDPPSAGVRSVMERSRVLFRSGFFCAESVLLSIAEARGIQSPLIPAVATGFCGGMSRTGGPCGALSGGVMALNLLYGRTRSEDSRDLNYALVARLVRDFRERFGSGNCSDLLGCDLGAPEGYAHFKEKDLIHAICLPVTVETAGRVMALIEETDASGLKQRK